MFNATGYVVPQTKADIASKATGRLEALAVVEGSHVRKDQVVARLESGDVVASMQRAAADVAAAAAAITEAQARLLALRARAEENAADLRESTRAATRADSMSARKFISDEAHDAALARRDRATAAAASAAADIYAGQAAVTAAEAHLAAARAALNETRVAVEYTLIRAPFDGVVLSKHADVGDVVAPFAATTQSKGAVVTMADMTTLEVEADIAESNLTALHAGQPCEIQLDALPDAHLRGEVDMIVPTVDRTKATVLAKVRFIDRDERVLPDMSARVSFLSRAIDAAEQHARTVVPVAAVVERDGHEVVFRVEGDQVAMLTLTAGARLGELREVGELVQPGDKLVLRPTAALSDGARVRSASAAH